MVKRYDPIIDPHPAEPLMEQCSGGLFVYYDDHQAEIERLKGLLEECRYALVTAPSNTKTSKELREALLKQIKEACDE